MTTTAPSPGEQLPWHADPYERALRSGRGPLFLRRADGWLLPLDVERWCARADEADRSVLGRCAGSVLDIGCGPGRMVAALTGDGGRALGIDSAPAAVRHTRRLGGPALCRSVFEPLPDEGRWDRALLLDGNIGIGGDPQALLRRVGALLAPGGLLLAEAATAEVEEFCEVCLDDGSGARGPAFPWARCGTGALRRQATAAGWRVLEEWTCAGRRFVALRSATAPRPARPGREAGRAPVAAGCAGVTSPSAADG
ncbi:class I SAM-dependent methyltransferase [Streptomyces sp. TRM70308]|uniref:methyltransferase domain-containing protein n=1 Tax=Streptomyces sp. TRM70308 TaxID=3131932 RepID=UPI003D033650